VKDQFEEVVDVRSSLESLAPRKALACIDIGGTKVAVALATRDGFLARSTELTVKTGSEDALARQVIAMIEATCRQIELSPEAVEAVGVASCGPFVASGGLMELATPNICGGLSGAAQGLPNLWRSVPLEGPLRERFARVAIANDAVAALAAERRWGALQGAQHCAYLTWSTGVGVGLCVDGRVLHGKNGNAGHVGHLFVNDDPTGSLCGCGNVGDVEAQVAGTAIERRFGTSAAALMQAAQEGDPAAAAIVDELCRVVGRALYNMVTMLDLERIALGGSVFWHHRDFLLPRLQARLVEHLPALTAGVLLVPAGLGLQVGDYGALAMVA
jgi:glucokinase